MFMSEKTHTSAEAFGQISNAQRKKLDDMIVDVVRQAMRSGARDMSMKEVQRAMNVQYGRWVELSSISGRVTMLVVDKKLLRTTQPRPCSVSGKLVNALSVPMQQADIAPASPVAAGGYY